LSATGDKAEMSENYLSPKPQPNSSTTICVGGFTEARKVAQLAADYGRLIVPHCWKTGIGIAASAHLGFAADCCPFIEYLPAYLSESVLRDELVADELEMIDGEISPPQKPGLGMDLNRDALRRYLVD
jgi:L-alanine-DL-glutamate epimerase-like enolase superfamily enzyme